MITQSQIKTALRRITAGEKKRLELRDDGERSAGRLLLIIGALAKRTAADLHAAWHRDRKRLFYQTRRIPSPVACGGQERPRPSMG